MEITFQGLERCASYWVDDLVTYSDKTQQHLEDLDTVFARILDSNMKLNPGKAEFLTGTVKYLGMLVEGDTFSIADKKLATINNLPTPKKQEGNHFSICPIPVLQKVYPSIFGLGEALAEIVKRQTEVRMDRGM